MRSWCEQAILVLQLSRCLKWTILFEKQTKKITSLTKPHKKKTNFLLFSVSFETDPRIPHTFWSILVGGIFLNANSTSLNQGQVPRYLSCKSKVHAKR